MPGGKENHFALSQIRKRRTTFVAEDQDTDIKKSIRTNASIPLLDVSIRTPVQATQTTKVVRNGLI
ncbi:MAG: hypothetical protein VR71_21930 [Roseovarius sp. BRH_c41]|nr:MAG: hypothetical protein VR71_21930 [Roseovarius sp. BRH_c41]